MYYKIYCIHFYYLMNHIVISINRSSRGHTNHKVRTVYGGPHEMPTRL